MVVRVLIVSIAGRDHKRRATLHRAIHNLMLQTVRVLVTVVVSGCGPDSDAFMRQMEEAFPDVEYLWFEQPLTQSEGWMFVVQSMSWDDEDIILLHDDDDVSHKDRARIQCDAILEQDTVTAVRVSWPVARKNTPRISRNDCFTIPIGTDTAAIGMKMRTFRTTLHNIGSSKGRFHDVKLWAHIRKIGWHFVKKCDIPLYFVRP